MTQGKGSIQISPADAAWLVGSVPQIFWLAGTDGKINFLSERFTELTGLDAVDVISNDRWKDVIYPDDLPSLEALWRNARAGASESRSYFRMRFRNGHYRWMHSVGRPVLSPDSGAITHWVGGLVDVDAELRAQHSVEDMNRELNLGIDTESDVVTRLRWRFRSLFHDRNIGVIEIDLAEVERRIDALRQAGNADIPRFLECNPTILDELVNNAKIVEMNRTLAIMLGVEDTDACLLGPNTIFARLGPRNPAALAVRALFTEANALEGVTQLDKAGGGSLSVAYAINISDDATCYATFVDITEQQKAAEMRLAVQSELARASRAATIGALSVSIAHELNQPITSMRLELRSLQQAISTLNDPRGPIQTGLERVTRQCERLTQIVQQTRDRILNHGRRVECVDLAYLAEEIPALLHREVEESSVQLEVETPGSACNVQADPIEIQQILVNLVLNGIEAIQASSAARRRVQLRIVQIDGFALVQVRDFGAGINESELARIFEPFFTTKAGGVGMGLQICRTIVEGLGGDLQARNVPGGGAIFEFRIPNGGEQMKIADGPPFVIEA